MDKQSFAERLNQRMKELGIRQKDIMKVTNKSSGAVSSWTKGAYLPKGDALKEIAKLLNTTTDWLLEGKGPKDAREALLAQVPESLRPALMNVKEAAEAGILPGIEHMPVVTWEKEEDLVEHGDYVFVPRIDIRADCGDGACVIHEEVLDQRQAFRAEWFAQKGIKPQHAACIYATGDSMEPRIFEGDTLLIDRSQKEPIINGKIYLLRYGDEIRVKQLFKRFDGGLIIRSFNREKYPDEEISAEDLAKGGIEVLGRVVWIGSEL